MNVDIGEIQAIQIGMIMLIPTAASENITSRHK